MKKRAKICFYIFVICAFCALGILGYFVFNDNGDNVMVGAGAKVLGPLEIGSNSKIAANAVVLHPVPENSTAVGIPARVVRRGGKRVVNDLDHVHMPDPVAQEIRRLKSELEHHVKQEERS